MLATETADSQKQPPTPAPPPETWAYNEPMRHVPSVEWLVRKLDVDVRDRIEKLLEPFGSLEPADPRRHDIETELQRLCRAFDRVAEVAKHIRPGHPPNDLVSRVTWALSHAVTNVRLLEGTPYGRRFPVHTFERSKAEPLYASILLVLRHVDHLITLVRAIDPGIDERLLAGLVNLQNPVDDRMLRPIA